MVTTRKVGKRPCDHVRLHSYVRLRARRECPRKRLRNPSATRQIPLPTRSSIAQLIHFSFEIENIGGVESSSAGGQRNLDAGQTGLVCPLSAVLASADTWTSCPSPARILGFAIRLPISQISPSALLCYVGPVGVFERGERSRIWTLM